MRTPLSQCQIIAGVLFGENREDGAVDSQDDSLTTPKVLGGD